VFFYGLARGLLGLVWKADCVFVTVVKSVSCCQISYCFS